MWHYSRTRQQAESTKLNVCYVPVWVSISVIVTKEVVLANLEKKLQLSYWVRRNIMPTVLSRAIFRGWSTLESRSSHNSGTWTYRPYRTWQIWQSKLLLFCPVSLRNIFVTKSIKSDKFFSICWGGRRLIRSRAQSSCCSVILLKDTFLCNVWIICNFFYFTILQLHPVVDFKWAMVHGSLFPPLFGRGDTVLLSRYSICNNCIQFYPLKNTTTYYILRFNHIFIVFSTISTDMTLHESSPLLTTRFEAAGISRYQPPPSLWLTPPLSSRQAIQAPLAAPQK